MHGPKNKTFLNISILDDKVIEFDLNFGNQIHSDALHFRITDT